MSGLAVVLVAVTLIIVVKTIFATTRLVQSWRYLAEPSAHRTATVNLPARIAIVIPVLREQNTIVTTITHLRSLARPAGLTVDVFVVGTIREQSERQARRAIAMSRLSLFRECRSLQEAEDRMTGHLTRASIARLWQRRHSISDADFAYAYDIEPSTADMVHSCVAAACAADGFAVRYVTAPDLHGNRATQINYALRLALSATAPPHYIGIYDADSRPAADTFVEIAHRFGGASKLCIQQPLHYLDSAEDLAHAKRSPVLVANALYQTTWSLIKEVPNLLAYARRRGGRPYSKSLYLNGHGEFFTRQLITTIGGVPEDARTDGIQVGYRLALADEPIVVARTFCSDDVPTNHMALFKQHMRWYAGNLEFWSAWGDIARRNGWHRYLAPAMDNLFLNATWALRPWVYTCTLCVVAFGPIPARVVLLTLLLGAGAVYAYLLPIAAVWITGRQPSVRLRDWVALPAAIAFKSLGPTAVLLALVVARLGGHCDIPLEKVER